MYMLYLRKNKTGNLNKITFTYMSMISIGKFEESEDFVKLFRLKNNVSGRNVKCQGKIIYHTFRGSYDIHIYIYDGAIV